ncbi:UNVERIFIED_CONTAM: Loganic acid O-methyltransferase [Sesamum radiatum]|uniref:Loganic acid O-methyltransferase n=1 Tax=Sesamum radiatum TaxID=300843 RepID=A0AAW2V839_SESRA
MAQLHGMTGGEGPLSYAQNSSYQRAVVDVIKPVIEEEIALKLHIKQLSPNRSMDSFWIADFGCSTGHNSFLAMQAVGLPGSFHECLLPKAFVHFAFSSWALHWLSQVPKAVADPNSPAWNKGAVFYAGAKQEVYDANSSQYAKDIESFLEARAQELVSGGLMALLVPGFPIKGRIREEKIDSFNFPTYYTFPEELKAIIEKNGNYSIERREIFDNPGKYAITSAHARASLYRAVFGELLTNHFGGEIIDEVFDTYRQKLEASPALLLPENDKSIMIFVLLKRRVE